MEYDPPSPPEIGLRGLRELRESGVLPPEVSKTADFQETVITLLLDAACLRNAMQNARGRWEEHLFARHLALVLYEGFNDMATLLPQATRQFAVAKTTEADNARKRLRDLNSSLATLQRRYATDLQFVRNAAAAHRDHDMHRFHEAVDSLDLERLEVAVNALLTWTATASATVMALLFRYSGVQSNLAEQLEAHADRIVSVTANPSGAD